MDTCSHTHLVQLPEPDKKLRCCHCHLTITQNELPQGFCPECFEMSGDKRYDFEPIVTSTSTTTKYRCEDCGVIIESD